MKKRGALDISIGTIVIVVIGVALLTFGLIFVADLGDNILDLMGSAFRQGRDQIDRLERTHTERLTITPLDQEVQRGKTETLYAYVANDLEEPATLTLQISSKEDNPLGSDELRVRLPKTSITVDPSYELKIPIEARADRKSKLDSNAYTMEILLDGKTYAEQSFFVEVVEK